MGASYDKHILAIEKAANDWGDSRFFTKDELVALYMYKKYLVNLLDDEGLEYRGESVKYGVPMVLLVVKVTRDGAGLVTFVSALNIISCYKTFIARLISDTVEWREDQFYRA